MDPHELGTNFSIETLFFVRAEATQLNSRLQKSIVKLWLINFGGRLCTCEP